MKYAVRLNAVCELCGVNHGFLTHQHRIIIADKASLPIMERFLKFQYNIVEVTDKDLGRFEREQIGIVDFVELLKLL